MEDPRRLLRKILNSISFVIMISCRNNSASILHVYINIYGKFYNHMSLKFDNRVIYENRVLKHNLTEEIIGPFEIYRDSIKVNFSIDNRDTSFM